MNRWGIFQNLIDWFYPRDCSACEKQLQWGGSPLCLPCESKLPYSLCRWGKNNALYHRMQGRTALSAAGFWLEFRQGTMGADLIHGMKYDNQLKLLKYLVRQWSRELKKDAVWEHVTLIPVPPNRWQSRKRGYHAASVIADELAFCMGWSVEHKALIRKMLTRSQTRLSQGDRWVNLENVYSANASFIPAGPLVLIDDVVTTGSTAERCLKLIREQTNEPLGLLSLAYTL